MSSEEMQPEQAKEPEEPTEKEDTGSEKTSDEFKKPLPKAPTTNIEKEEENKLRSRYPGLKAAGGSALLQKRLAKPQKYFDSGDYAMAKAKKAPMPVGSKLAYNIPVAPTGEEHPTPETVPTRKASLVQNKLLTRLT